jgi:YjbE family integral membrane protein
MEFLFSLASIILINIILSGDNAVIIALASRGLPPKQQKAAILWGSVGAIALRVVLTIVAVMLLQVPYLQFAGGIVLVWIGIKLLLDNGTRASVQETHSFWSAIKTIVVADIVMSLDNTLAIAAVANGHYVLLAIGLALSIPIIILGSKLIIFLMERFSIIIYAGAALIAWTAGEMIIADPKIGASLLAHMPGWIIPLGITLGTVGVGLQVRNRQKGDTPKGIED